MKLSPISAAFLHAKLWFFEKMLRIVLCYLIFDVHDCALNLECTGRSLFLLPLSDFFWLPAVEKTF